MGERTERLIRESAVLPVSRLDHSAIADPEPSFWQRHRKGLSLTAVFLIMVFAGATYAMNTIRPFSSAVDLNVLNHQLEVLIAPEPLTPTVKETVADVETKPATEELELKENNPASSQVKTWFPIADELFWKPQDYPNVGKDATRVFVVTIRARVTAYTPYDHAQSHPQWADGVVAWHPRNRKRRVTAHPYCLASDWTQFPGGATFIRVPGYMPKSFPSFPENFRVVDDKCGRARLDNRNGMQPVIDVRYLTRHSAISGGKDAWGMKQLDVEVIFPANFQIPRSLTRWIVSAEWRTYENGELIKSETVQ